MSDPATPGEPTSAPAVAANPAPAPAPSANTASFGSFSNTRGSGLLRGKRPTHPATSPTAAVSPASDYKPTALEVITPVREYQNPFASGTPENPAPATPPAPPAEPVAAAVEPAPAAPVAIAIPAPAPAPLPVADPAPVAPAAPAEKPELKILPPEDVKRPAQSWGEHAPQPGGDSRPRRDDRATFRPERRDAKPFEPREPRREPAIEQRGPLPSAAQPAPAARKSGGFFGWLKGLFGGKAAAAETPPAQGYDSNRDGEYRHHRNRQNDRRGGYQGENRGARDYQPRDPRDYPEDEQQQGERRFEGGGRRRRRGGRGRHRDDRGGPRSEGQQGGGAI